MLSLLYVDNVLARVISGNIVHRHFGSMDSFIIFFKALYHLKETNHARIQEVLSEGVQL